MARTVGIGIQDFEEIIQNHCFYVDKTEFIREWWEARDEVTLVTRPRRFGKTLAMSMLERFFSVRYAGQGEIFEGLAIWEHEDYRGLQGTYPVISLSFANIKGHNYDGFVRKMIGQTLANIYHDYAFLLDGDLLTADDRNFFCRVTADMEDSTAALALHQLSRYLYLYYGKKVIILLDEFDTPMQEAYINGYWDEMTSLIRSMFHSAFKTNPYLERAILTGITRISKESIFSDLNNLEVITTTSDKYADVFGFTEQEVFAAMDEMGLSDRETVKTWYDGFIIGNVRDIYNPWSITNFLEKGKIAPYWANSSGNALVGKLLREGDADIKIKFEELLAGNSIISEIDEEIVFSQLDRNREAVWSLLLASGYLKVLHVEGVDRNRNNLAGQDAARYELALTNGEVRYMFKRLIADWFDNGSSNYKSFLKALLLDDVDAMNEYMGRVVRSVFSYFDTQGSEPERFYHGFVLGLMMELEGRYIVRSNRESGFGRYDVMLEPAQKNDTNAIIIEFKVFNPRKENTLEDTVQTALQQIEDKKYGQELVDRGIARKRIRKYGFAFEGKNVLIG